MFKKLKQKISEEQQQLQQALASTQVRRPPLAHGARSRWTRAERTERRVGIPRPLTSNL